MDIELHKELLSNLKQAVTVVKGDKSGSAKPYVVFTPADVKAIRSQIKMSQHVFANEFNIPLDTLKGWEQGKRTLDATQTNYLRMIVANPEYVRETIAT